MYRLSKRVPALLILTVFLFAQLAGCKKEKTDQTAAQPNPRAIANHAKPLIGVSLLALTNPFFKDMGDAFKEEGEKRGYEVVVVSGENDPAKQNDQVKDFLVRKASAIVLTPCNSKSVGTAIAEANAAGVPVFTADVAATAEGVKVVSHTATDNYEGGKIAGKAMVELLGGKGIVAVIDHPAVESGQMREKGFLEEVAKSPDIQVVAKLAGDGARDKSHTVAQDLIQAHADLDGIFAINDPTALGAIAAIEEASKIGKIKVIGFDGQPEAKRAVMDGKMYATILQYPRRIASVTVDSISKYMAADQVPASTLISPALYRPADAAKDPELKQ